MENIITIYFKLVYSCNTVNIQVDKDIKLSELKSNIEIKIKNNYDLSSNEYDIIETGHGEMYQPIDLSEEISLKDRFAKCGYYFYIRPINFNLNNIFTCMICFEYHNPRNRITLSCTHVFGSECYNSWCNHRINLGLQPNCPYCRR
jgi:hypothetical protein